MWEENKHPRDKSGQFTSKGNEGQGGAKPKLEAQPNRQEPIITKKEEIEDDFDNDFEEEFKEESVKTEDPAPAKRTKTAGIKERKANSKKLLTDFINDFIDDDEAATLKDKLAFIKKDFDAYYEGWKHDYPNYQDAFTHYIMDSGLASMYYDDIYDDLIEIGYVDDPKYKEDTDKLERIYGYNLYNAFKEMLSQEE